MVYKPFYKTGTFCSGIRYLRKQTCIFGIEIGRRDGIEIGGMEKLRELVGKKLAKGKSIETIAEELEESVESIRSICNFLEKNVKTKNFTLPV